MVAYEIYCSDPGKEYELLGILPERRKKPRRITEASVMNWGKMLLVNNESGKSIFYRKITISEYTGKLIRIAPSSIPVKN